MKITLQSQFTLYPLSIRKDKKNYIVEEPVSGDFFEMPEICIDAIERIKKGQPLGEIEHELREKYPHEDVDMIEFGEQLLELGLVQEIDGKKMTTKKEIRSVSGFTWLPPSVGRFFFNGIANKVYLILLLVNISLIVWNPGLFPHYQDIFIFDSMMLNIITYMLISLVLIIIHEFGHILAIRSYDLPATLGIGNRLIFVVFETDLTAAWKLEPRQRNILYFAGMSFEQLCVLLALAVQLLFPEANAILLGILGIVVFDIFIKTIYQCCFYMKTDIYYFIENSTGCYNLMENGKQFLSRWLPFLKSDAGDAESFDGEQKIVRLYSVFYIVGILLTLSLILFYFLPQAYYAYSKVFSNLLWSSTPAAFWDAIAFLGQTVILLGLFVYSKRKA
ncbi:peptidase [Sporosarcina highlanderae]|uniref:Peptidase n=1 Tax=Sporosarcina highlanderae TaxID=3035916 RepID=A0ABT8JV03_9BACL|nr:peptidase [Sporosarcina highlanderae]MDN4608772.1 peptidase [Sporosarcina highlanderae]